MNGSRPPPPDPFFFFFDRPLPSYVLPSPLIPDPVSLFFLGFFERPIRSEFLSGCRFCSSPVRGTTYSLFTSPHLFYLFSTLVFCPRDTRDLGEPPSLISLPWLPSRNLLQRSTVFIPSPRLGEGQACFSLGTGDFEFPNLLCSRLFFLPPPSDSLFTPSLFQEALPKNGLLLDFLSLCVPHLSFFSLPPCPHCPPFHFSPPRGLIMNEVVRVDRS